MFAVSCSGLEELVTIHFHHKKKIKIKKINDPLSLIPMHIICDSHEEAEGEEGRYLSFLFHSCNSPLYYNPRSKIWTFKHKARSVSGGRQITSYLLLPDNYYILSIVVKFISSAVLPHRFIQPIIQPQVSPAISINLRVISDGVGMENIFIMLHHRKELYID